jgi:hypothetical protein
MTTILNKLASALRAILRSLAQTPYTDLCGPIWWPSEIHREASERTMSDVTRTTPSPSRHR